MYCAKCFPWLMESVKDISLTSSFTVVQPVPLKHVLATKMTSCHLTMLQWIKEPDAMCMTLCLGAKEIELPFCIVKTTVLNRSWMNGFLKQEGNGEIFLLPVSNQVKGVSVCGIKHYLCWIVKLYSA